MAPLVPKKLQYLKEIYNDRPGSQTIHAFNRSLERGGVGACMHQPTFRHTNIGRSLDQKGLLKNFVQLPGRAYIVALMWPKAARLFPVGYVREVIPLCFDCWPVDYHKWEDLFKKNRIKTAFFTARQSQDYFAQRIPGMKCYWLAEACDPDEYPYTKPLADRNIDVLELGRRMEEYHDGITGQLGRAGHCHLYVKDGERRMFGTRQELMDCWADTRISICFPKSMTSDERSGGVETVTFRYFESMATRCLVVGHCPQELQDIFGYNPVIEADLNDPAGQLLKLLADIEQYQPFVEENHKRLLEVGCWDARVKDMLTTLTASGYTL